MNLHQERLLNILIELKRVSDKYNLRYFLDCGTLLGAIRHKGFIPWDDDIDIGMPLDDYLKLLELAKGGVFKDDFFLSHFDNTDKFIWEFAKLVDKNTTCIESIFEFFRSDYKSGIWIDIFPFIGCGDDINNAKAHLFTLKQYLDKWYSHFWEVDFDYNGSGARFRRFLYRRVYCFFHLLSHTPYNRVWKHKVKSLMKKYSFEDSQFVASSFFIDKSMTCLIRKDMLFPLSKALFQGYKFSIPNDFNKYLTNMYGDYLQIPKQEDRIVHPIAFLDLDLPFNDFNYDLIDKSVHETSLWKRMKGKGISRKIINNLVVLAKFY